MIGNIEGKHSIKVKGTILGQVKAYKYLGVMLNSEGNIKKQLNETIVKTGNSFRTSKNCALEKPEVPEKAKVKVMKRIVKSSKSWVTTVLK